MTRPLLFDIDGTLVDTLGAGRAALERAMIEVYDETGPIDELDFHGRTDPSIVRELLGLAGKTGPWISARFPILWRTYLAFLEEELSRREGQVTLFEGVLDLLEALDGDERYLVGLVTGNLEGGAIRKLRAGGIAERFNYGAYGSDSERRADLPPIAVDRASELIGSRLRTKDAIVIGDTPEDISCARASGARVIAVATGRHGPAELRHFRPDAVVESLAETDDILQILAE
ncbi:MAG: HAD hydrolase-like protein [marine benthic group bacterium]|nr:HAD hydrolase-like protein [Candidatus Carthagonibacter metallireducens]